MAALLDKFLLELQGTSSSLLSGGSASPSLASSSSSDGGSSSSSDESSTTPTTRHTISIVQDNAKLTRQQKLQVLKTCSISFTDYELHHNMCRSSGDAASSNVSYLLSPHRKTRWSTTTCSTTEYHPSHEHHRNNNTVSEAPLHRPCRRSSLEFTAVTSAAASTTMDDSKDCYESSSSSLFGTSSNSRRGLTRWASTMTCTAVEHDDNSTYTTTIHNNTWKTSKKGEAPLHIPCRRLSMEFTTPGAAGIIRSTSNCSLNDSFANTSIISNDVSNNDDNDDDDQDESADCDTPNKGHHRTTKFAEIIDKSIEIASSTTTTTTPKNTPNSSS